MAAQPASESKRFFVGISGEQKGPFSESEIWDMIRSNEINATTPLWYEGLPDWQTVGNIPPFNQGEPPKESKRPSGSGKSKSKPRPAESTEHLDEEREVTFAGAEEVTPVFRKGESTFAKRAFMDAYGKHVVLGSIAVLFSAALYYIFIAGGDLLETVQNTTAFKKPAKAPETRETKVRRALSELLLSPAQSVEVLKNAWKENPKDELGQKAFAALIDYYETRSPQEAGRMYVENNQPEEAIRFFMMEPPSYSEAAAANAKAAEVTTDAAKKKAFLLEEIRLLLGPASGREQALIKLQAFSKAYPGEQHPYQYYTKTTEQKIQDLFDRLSFYYVQNLLAYLDTEFKQTRLVSRPRIQIIKEPSGNYRLAGTYVGDLTLSRDRLTNIKLIFWLVKEQWVLVETNLTEERAKFAKAEKEKQKDLAMTAEQMLTYLETVFKTQYPKTALHEKPDLTKPKTNE